MVLKTDFHGFVQLVIANIASLAILYYLWSIEHGEEVVRYVVACIAIFFCFQLVVSWYESSLGYFLAGGSELNDTFDQSVGLGFEGRVLMRMFPGDIPLLSGLKLPFSGLLGQHNFWGTQLPMYNLLFLLWHRRRRSRLLQTCLVLTPIAAILNTSRFGIGAILATDLFYMLWINKSLRLVLLCLTVSIGPFVIINFESLLASWTYYFTHSDTLTGRVWSYSMSLDVYSSQDMLNILIGAGSLGIHDLVNLSSGWGSFENEFIARLMTFGVAGLLWFIAFLCVLAAKAIHLKGESRQFAVLLVLNVILVSVTSNLVFVYSSFVIVTLVYYTLYFTVEDTGERCRVMGAAN